MIIKNKSTGESKGLGYVRYYKPSQAAQAIENCDKSKVASSSSLDWLLGGDGVVMMTLSLAYRAILAEPRIKASSSEDYAGASTRSDYMGGGDTMTPYPPPLRMQPDQDFFS